MHGLPLGRLQLSRLALDRSQRLCRRKERQQTERDRAPHRSMFLEPLAECAAKLILSNASNAKTPWQSLPIGKNSTATQQSISHRARENKRRLPNRPNLCMLSHSRLSLPCSFGQSA